ELLDRSHGSDEHAKALHAQKAKVSDPSLTPSAQVLASMTEHKESFSRFALRQSQAHAEFFRAQALAAEQQQGFETAARES
ncbi:glutamate--cysteine ligase, partial [Pseudomonas frederiksbergensis]|nr:glutamate--cysteine ligase [Pseudomonas frederiksbergensis]